MKPSNSFYINLDPEPYRVEVTWNLERSLELRMVSTDPWIARPLVGQFVLDFEDIAMGDVTFMQYLVKNLQCAIKHMNDWKLDNPQPLGVTNE